MPGDGESHSLEAKLQQNTHTRTHFVPLLSSLPLWPYTGMVTVSHLSWQQGTERERDTHLIPFHSALVACIMLHRHQPICLAQRQAHERQGTKELIIKMMSGTFLPSCLLTFFSIWTQCGDFFFLVTKETCVIVKEMKKCSSLEWLWAQTAGDIPVLPWQTPNI